MDAFGMSPLNGWFPFKSIMHSSPIAIWHSSKTGVLLFKIPQRESGMPRGIPKQKLQQEGHHCLFVWWLCHKILSGSIAIDTVILVCP